MINRLVGSAGGRRPLSYKPVLRGSQNRLAKTRPRGGACVFPIGRARFGLVFRKVLRRPFRFRRRRRSAESQSIDRKNAVVFVRLGLDTPLRNRLRLLP